MGDLGTSLGVGSELVLRIGPEFGVWSCVTQSRNKYIITFRKFVNIQKSSEC